MWQLFGFFARWDFVLYALVVSGYSGLLYMSIQKIERIEREDGVHSSRYAHYRALHRFAYPALSGTVGAQSVLFAKCVVELLANTWRNWQQEWDGSDGGAAAAAAHAAIPSGFNGTDGTGSYPDIIPPSPIVYQDSTNMFFYWQTYFVIGAMLGAISAQIKYLNDGLSRFDASYSVPVFTSHWIILSVVSGMIFYRGQNSHTRTVQGALSCAGVFCCSRSLSLSLLFVSEYAGMDGAQCMLFACGVAITVTGVITLGGREQSHPSTGSGSGGAHQPLAQHERSLTDVKVTESCEPNTTATLDPITISAVAATSHRPIVSRSSSGAKMTLLTSVNDPSLSKHQSTTNSRADNERSALGVCPCVAYRRMTATHGATND